MESKTTLDQIFVFPKHQMHDVKKNNKIKQAV